MRNVTRDAALAKAYIDLGVTVEVRADSLGAYWYRIGQRIGRKRSPRLAKPTRPKAARIERAPLPQTAPELAASIAAREEARRVMAQRKALAGLGFAG